ncbi:MAG TPA: LapA family protein [Longimicrobium sp.]|nr:LapA family protein [Longimicrobium sp.]
MRGPRWLPPVGAALLAAGFAYLNVDETARLHLGLFTWERAPLAPLLLTAFVLGMGAMYLLGLRHDRRVREALRERGLLDASRTASPSPVNERTAPREEDGFFAPREAPRADAERSGGGVFAADDRAPHDDPPSA